MERPSTAGGSSPGVGRRPGGPPPARSPGAMVADSRNVGAVQAHVEEVDLPVDGDASSRPGRSGSWCWTGGRRRRPPSGAGRSGKLPATQVDPWRSGQRRRPGQRGAVQGLGVAAQERRGCRRPRSTRAGPPGRPRPPPPRPPGRRRRPGWPGGRGRPSSGWLPRACPRVGSVGSNRRTPTPSAGAICPDGNECRALSKTPTSYARSSGRSLGDGRLDYGGSRVGGCPAVRGGLPGLRGPGGASRPATGPSRCGPAAPRRPRPGRQEGPGWGAR